MIVAYIIFATQVEIGEIQILRKSKRATGEPE